MNFTALSCYLSMPFTKTHTLMQTTNTPRLIFAGYGFGWLPHSGACRYTQVVETRHSGQGCRKNRQDSRCLGQPLGG